MNDENKAAPQRKKWPTWVRRIVILLLGIEVGWLIIAHLFLNTPLGPWAINRKPEKYTVSWERVLTPYPAKVYVTGFSLEQKTPNIGVTITADKVKARVGILPFLLKTMRATGVEVEGVSVKLDRSGGSGLPKSKKTKAGLKIKLLGVTVHSIKEFGFDDVSIIGGTSGGTGSFEMQVRRDMEINDADLHWDDAVIDLGEESLAEALDIGFRGGFSPFNPKVEKGLAMLAHLSGDIDVNGHVRSLVPLKIFFAGTKWIEKLDGEGDVAVALKLKDGLLQPGTVIDVDADELLLDFMGFRATGVGRVDGKVDSGEETREAFVAVTFDDFEFGRQAEEQPLARGTGLVLETRSEGIGAAEMLSGMNVTLDLPEANVPDISFLSRTLPPDAGVSITGGLASLAVHMEAQSGREKAEGIIQLKGEDLSGSFQDFDFKTDLDFTTRISGNDWDNFEVRLAGTEFKLFDGVFHHPDVEVTRGWWMTLEVPEGRANFAMPLEAEAEVDLSMRDTRVIVALFAEMKSWIRHFDGLLTVEDVVGHTQAAVADKELSLRELSLEGDKLEVLGELELGQEGERSGLIWARVGIFKLALERIGDEREWKMINAREWFDEKRAANWVSAEGEALAPESEGAPEEAETE